MFDAGQDICWILLWEIRVVGTLTLLGRGLCNDLAIGASSQVHYGYLFRVDLCVI